MAAVHLAACGGRQSFFLGFISAVAFATILAVVSGLTLAGASAISTISTRQCHRRRTGRTRKTEVRVSKWSRRSVLGIVAVLLGIVFEKQNVAFMVGLAFAIAASCNFPVLLMSLVWRDMTTRGAVIGGFLGLLTGLIGVILSPSVWVEVLGHPKGSAPFPYTNPALFSMTIAFIGIYVFSKLDNSARAAKDRAGFDAEFVRAQTGIGASGSSGH